MNTQQEIEAIDNSVLRQSSHNIFVHCSREQNCIDSQGGHFERIL